MQHRFKTFLSYCLDEHLLSHISFSGSPMLAVHLYCFSLICILKCKSHEMMMFLIIEDLCSPDFWDFGNTSKLPKA